MRVLLYARVSTTEQEKEGYSLPQQVDALQEYCKENGYEVVGVFSDQGSRSTLDRPGLDALLDVVEAGGIGLVLAQDRDRFAAGRVLVQILRDDLERHGTTMVALTSPPPEESTPHSRLLENVQDDFSEYEREIITERTRRGRLRKAREGKIVGNARPPFGFYLEGDQYRVDEEKMRFVREIFKMIASGGTIYGVIQHMDRSPYRTPSGGPWNKNIIRRMILNDAYGGTHWFNRVKKTEKTVSKMVGGERVYERKTTREERPREEWIAIPVTDSGIPEATITRARERLSENTYVVSKYSGRTWELSGGVAVCSECGNRMAAFSPGGKAYFYYRCPNKRGCPNKKHYPASNLEERVRTALVGTFNEETWEEFVNETTERQIADLHRLHRSPQETRRALGARIEGIQGKLSRLVDLYTSEDVTREIYQEKRAALLKEEESIREYMEKLGDLETEVNRIEDLRTALLSLESPFSGHHVFVGDTDLNVLLDHNLSYGSKETAARRRQQFYREVGLRVKVGDGCLELSLGLCDSARRSPGPPG